MDMDDRCAKHEHSVHHGLLELSTSNHFNPGGLPRPLGTAGGGGECILNKDISIKKILHFHCTDPHPTIFHNCRHPAPFSFCIHFPSPSPMFPFYSPSFLTPWPLPPISIASLFTHFFPYLSPSCLIFTSHQCHLLHPSANHNYSSHTPHACTCIHLPRSTSPPSLYSTFVLPQPTPLF